MALLGALGLRRIGEARKLATTTTSRRIAE
jgi:hypothetical protein